jgi:sugar phosphate isomerase/epimerase
MPTRRDFIQLSALGLLSASIPDTLKVGLQSQYRLSVQLYTIRKEIEKDIKGALKRLADIGFKNVETAFWPDNIPVQRAAEYVKEFGFHVSSCHVEIPTGKSKQAMLDVARAFDCKDMIWHGWPEDLRYSSLEGTRQLISIYNDSNKFARDNGLRFGLHNHWWEYRNRVGGKLVYEILNEELDPDIFFETDTYWVKVAGHDPVEIIQSLKNRIRFLHIKDGPAAWNENLAVDNPDPMTPVGQGTQNIPAIVNAAGDHTEWMVIEMDKTAIDVFDALQQSLEYMSKFKSISVGQATFPQRKHESGI